MKKIAYFLLALSLFFVSCKRDFSDSKMKITLPDSAITAIERNSSDSELLRVKINFQPVTEDDQYEEMITRIQTVKKSSIKNGSFTIKITRVPINKHYNIDITISNSKGNIIWETSSELYVEAGINNIEMLANTHEYGGSFNILSYDDKTNPFSIEDLNYFTHIITYTDKDGNSIEKRVNKEQVVFKIEDIPYNAILQKKDGEDYIDPEISTQCYPKDNGNFGVISDFTGEGNFRLEIRYKDGVKYKYFNAKKIFYTDVNTNIHLYDFSSTNPATTKNTIYRMELPSDKILKISKETSEISESVADFAFMNKSETNNTIFYVNNTGTIKAATTPSYTISNNTSFNYNKVYYDFSTNSLYAMTPDGKLSKWNSTNSFSSSATKDKDYTISWPDSSIYSNIEIQEFAVCKEYIYIVVKLPDCPKNQKIKLLIGKIESSNSISMGNATDLFSLVSSSCLYRFEQAEDIIIFTDLLVLPYEDENTPHRNIYLTAKQQGTSLNINPFNIPNQNLFSYGYILKGEIINSQIKIQNEYYSNNINSGNSNQTDLTKEITWYYQNEEAPDSHLVYGAQKIIGITYNTIFIADSGILFNIQNFYNTKYIPRRQYFALDLNDFTDKIGLIGKRQVGKKNAIKGFFYSNDQTNNPRVSFDKAETDNIIYQDTMYYNETTIDFITTLTYN